MRGQESARKRSFEFEIFNEGSADDSNTVVATVSPAVISAPRPVTGRRREAGVLASGSSLASSFPKQLASVDLWTFARRLQLRGQPRFQTAFRFKSLAGTLREGRIILAIPHRSTPFALGPQHAGVVLEMIADESLNEIVAVIVAGLHAQGQCLARLRCGRGELLRL